MTNYIGSGGDNPEDGAAPRNEAANQNDQAKDTTPTTPHPPKSQREVRALEALARGAVYRADMDTIIGTGNAPEYISRLRLAGWGIVTERVSAIDRDGKRIKVGRYRMSPDHMAMAATVARGMLGSVRL